MIYKNIEVFNTVEAENVSGGVRFLRVPKRVTDSLEMKGGLTQAYGSTGVELRFVVKSGKAKIRMKAVSSAGMLNTFHIFYGGLQGGWAEHETNTLVSNEETEYEFSAPGNLDTLRKIARESKIDFDPSVVRVIFDRGSYVITGVEGDIAPPDKSLLPKKTLLCYGSSITHGSNSIDMSHSWASVVGHNLNMDVRNLGFAGSCAAEEEMVDFIASEGEGGKWDAATLALGINVLGWEEEKIARRVKNAVSEIAGRNPDKKVIVISPIYCNEDYAGGKRPDTWRRIIRDECEKLNLPNIRYINGLDLLGNISLISADMVHPNIYGVSEIACKLTKILGEEIK